MSSTLYGKLFDSHVVSRRDDGTCLLYVDRHLMHEVTTAQPFAGIRARGLMLARLDTMLAMPDHNVTTGDRSVDGSDDDVGALQLATLRDNVALHGVDYFDLRDPRQGIVHVAGPEQGFTLPGTTLVCGDSHTSTHGAFGALAFGIGTSEVEHVLATQTIVRRRALDMRIDVTGLLPPGITAKDVVLAIIGDLGTAAGTGHVIEFTGTVIRGISMEARMTICNMAIEIGARTGLVAPDETTFDYLRGRPRAPRGDAWDAALAHWRTLRSDPDAHFDKVESLDVSHLAPQVTWGTSPEQVAAIDARVPDPASLPESRRAAAARALAYMGLDPGTALADIAIDHAFIGSCTNSRIEDLRDAARIARGRKVHAGVRALVVPGSGLVKAQAEADGLDRVFRDAGFEWREPGCSMCVAMNADRVPVGGRCASSSNRNFEGRQGRDARTHLMSPAMVAAAAIAGHLTDARALA